MKKLFLSSLFAFVIVSALISCKQDSGLTDAMPMKAPPPPPPSAHPAWTFTSSTLVRSKGTSTTYYTVAVSDSDASNITNVYTSSVALTSIMSPTWSANGGSISFIEQGTNAIRAVDVSIVSGVPSGSNARTIYTAASGTTMSYQTWCQASTNAVIAFVAHTGTVWSVYTVSTSGGAATQIYTAASGDEIGSLAWSNDGTEIAIAYKSGTTLSMKVIDAITGAENASLVAASGYTNIATLSWSHSGSNTLAFTAVSGGVDKLYTISPVAGSTETFLINGSAGSWSPDNSELVYNAGTATEKVTVGTGATSGAIGTYDMGVINWKKP